MNLNRHSTKCFHGNISRSPAHTSFPALMRLKDEEELLLNIARAPSEPQLNDRILQRISDAAFVPTSNEVAAALAWMINQDLWLPLIDIAPKVPSSYHEFKLF